MNKYDAMRHRGINRSKVLHMSSQDVGNREEISVRAQMVMGWWRGRGVLFRVVHMWLWD